MTTDLDPRASENYNHKPRVLNREVFYPGDIIIRQGDPGYRAFYIENGHVEIRVHDGPHVVSVSHLGPGEIFGEMSLIDGGNRTASAIAVESTTVTVISKDELDKVIDHVEQKSVKALLHVLISRLRRANQGQLQHYKNLTSFQDRVTGLVEHAGEGIDGSKREAFRKEAEPLLEQLDELLARYQNGTLKH